MKGTRCLNTIGAELWAANPSDLLPFQIVNVDPVARALDSVTVRIRYSPVLNNTTPVIGVILRVRDYETLRPGDTTFAIVFDTVFISAPSREAEFQFARQTDTVRFGKLCVGDTATADWDVLNIGGCDIEIIRDSIAMVTGAPAFAFLPKRYPIRISRTTDSTMQFRFTPTVPGIYTAYAIIISPHFPFRDTLILTGIAELPAVTLRSTSITLDTVCINTNGIIQIPIRNQTACPVRVDSIQVRSSISGWSLQQTAGFTIPPNNQINVALQGRFSQPGSYSSDVIIHSSGRKDTIRARVVVVERSTVVTDTIRFNDVLLNTVSNDELILIAQGTVPSIVNSITLSGLFATDYTITLPAGLTLPHTLQPNDTLRIRITFIPKDIEQRPASLTLALNSATSCPDLRTTTLRGRGVQPLLDARSRTIVVGRLCAGDVLDTVINLRNPGNALLTIDTILITGDRGFTIQSTGRIQIPADSSFPIQLRYTSADIGNRTATLTLRSNGKWISSNDTSISLNAVGIVCGTLSLDTVDAEIGTVARIPIRYTPPYSSALSALQIVELMNSSANTALDLQISYGESLLDITGLSGATSMLSPYLNAALQKSPPAINISTQNLSLNPSDVVAVIDADVLLGREFNSPLQLRIESFANGYSRLNTVNGLVRAQYCSFDKRLVDGTTVQLTMAVTQNGSHPALTVYTHDDRTAAITLINTQGERVANLHSGLLKAGISHIHIPDDIPSGLYGISLQSDSFLRTAVCLIIR
ncbi:MAG: choice-of-anchor D domain-containing protein [Candidatus Kapabacteria bacterium]|nr:choice-of-anchor D domain-containing protein [Candidatus Kapabacteria bacterium]